MYAVIKTGGKQYRVSEGDILNIEKLDNELGEKIVFSQVLMVAGDKDTVIGTPIIKTAKVEATIKAHNKSKKVLIIKFRRRKHHMKRQGHRQNITQIEINKIII